jgi:sugar phosphate isomerase/epimerase
VTKGTDEVASGTGLTRADFLRGTVATGVGATIGGALPFTASAAQSIPQPVGGQPVVSAFIRAVLGMDMPTLAKFLNDAGFDGAEVPVRANLSYIRPDQVAEQLPRLADALARRGKRIYCVTSDILSADAPHAETIVKTVASLGIPRYRLGFFRYDLNAPIYPQREALRSAVRGIAQLNQSYGVLGVYQNHSGPEYVSASLWDYYELIRDLPSKHMAFVYDVAHATIEGGTMWRQTWKLAQTHLGYVSVKDFRWDKNAVKWAPLGTGQVDPKIFTQVRADYRGDYSLHVEYEPLQALAENAAALRRDVQTLRRLLAQ